MHVFANPVTHEDAPDYHTIVKRPMCWQQMRNKLFQREYNSVQDFKVCFPMNSGSHSNPPHPTG